MSKNLGSKGQHQTTVKMGQERSLEQMGAPGGGGNGPGGGGGGAMPSSQPFTNMPSTPPGGWDGLATGIAAVGNAYADMLTKASKEIDWESRGDKAGNAATGYWKLANSLRSVGGSLEALSKQESVVKLIQDLGKIAPALSSSKLMNAASQAGNIPTDLQVLGGKESKTLKTNGWDSTHLGRTGPTHHELTQEYAAIRAQALNVWRTGMSTVSHGTWQRKQVEAEALQNRAKNLLVNLSTNASSLSDHDRKFLVEQGNASKLGLDLTTVHQKINDRKLAASPASVTDFASAFSAAKGLVTEFKRDRSGVIIREADQWHQQASRLLESEKDVMSKGDYTRKRSQLNTLGSSIHQLVGEGAHDPKSAARAVGEQYRTLNAELALYRKGGNNLGAVQGALASVNGSMGTYGSFMTDAARQQLQAGINTRSLEIATLTTVAGADPVKDALRTSLRLRNGYRWTGSFNGDEAAAAKEALAGQYAAHNAVLGDPQSAAAARDKSEAAVKKLTAEMEALDKVSKKAGGSFGEMNSKIMAIAGAATGFYSIAGAISAAATRAIEFDQALRRVDAMLTRLPSLKDRASYSSAIKKGAMQDAIDYGMDPNTTLMLHTNAVMGTKGSLHERSRLGSTMSQLAFTSPTQYEEYASMVAPLTNAGLSANTINRFFQSSNVLQGQLNLSPDRMKAFLSSVAANAPGLGTLTDWETAQAVAAHEAAATKDMVMGSKLNRVQMAFRNPKNIAKLQKILSRGGQRSEINGVSIEEITNSGVPMASIDRIAQMYKRGDITNNELNGVAQTIDMWSSPGTMNLLKNGLDDWRSKVRQAGAVADAGFSTTGQAAAAQSEAIGASVARINNNIAALATEGINPLGKSIKGIADLFSFAASPQGALGRAISSLAFVLASVAAGSAASKGTSLLIGALGGKDKDGNNLGVGSAFKNLFSGGGLLGLGVGLGTAALSWGYDKYQQVQADKVKSLNEEGARRVVINQSHMDSQDRAVSLVSEITALQEKGELTEKRRLDLTNSLTKATGDQHRANLLVLSALKGQTAELQIQLGLMDAGKPAARVGAAIATLANLGNAKPDFYTDQEAANGALRAIGELQAQARSSAGLPAALGTGLDQYARQAGYMSMGAPSEVLKTLDLSKSNPGQLQLLAGVVFGATQNNPAVANLAVQGGGHLAPKGDKKGARESAMGASTVLGKAQVGSHLNALLGGLGTAKDKEKYVDSNLDAFVQSLWNTKEQTNQFGADRASVDTKFQEILSKGAGNDLNPGKFGREATISRLVEQFSKSKSLQNLFRDRISASGTLTKDNASDFASRLMNDTYTIKHLNADDQRAVAMAHFGNLNAASMSTPGQKEKLGRGSGSPSYASDNWINAFDLVKKMAAIPSESGFRKSWDNVKSGSFAYGKEVFASPEKAYNHDVEQLQKAFDLRINRDGITAEEKEQERAWKVDQLSQLEMKRDTLMAMVGSRESMFQTQEMTKFKNQVELSTALDGGKFMLKHKGMLSSADPVTAEQGNILVDADMWSSRNSAYESAFKSGKIGKEGYDRVMLDHNTQRLKLAARARQGLISSMSSEQEFKLFAGEVSNPLQFNDSDFKQRDRMKDLIKRQIEQEEKYLALIPDDQSTIEERIKVLRRRVDLEKQSIELDSDVIRAKRAYQVGLGAQDQVVDTLFNFNAANTASRGKNLLGIGEGLVNRGITDSIKDAMSKEDNPMAKALSFVYDPTGAMSAQTATERNTSALQKLTDRIGLLVNSLELRTKNAQDTASYVSGATGSSVAPQATTPRGTVSSVAKALSGPSMESSIQASASEAFADKVPGFIPGMPSAASISNYSTSPYELAPLDEFQAPTLAPVSNLSPSTGENGGSPASLSDDTKLSAIEQEQKRNKARNNPLFAMSGNASFGGSFWGTGGMGRKAGTVSKYGGKNYTVDSEGYLVKKGSPGVSTTGAIAGGAQVAMAGASAWYGNQGNGRASQNYAATGAMAGVAGSLVIAGTANAWNPVGWALLAVGAIASIMSGIEASKKQATDKNKQYEEKLADFQKQIAIQEEQKKAIGLMAEKVLSIRGEVGNSFEGVASSAFLSGRWAGRAPSISVGTLTVVANNPTELSQSLTTALTTQVRQGA